MKINDFVGGSLAAICIVVILKIEPGSYGFVGHTLFQSM